MTDTPQFIQVTTVKGEVIAFRKDTIHTVIAKSYQSRNIGCFINGIEVTTGYDTILKELGWEK